MLQRSHNVVAMRARKPAGSTCRNSRHVASARQRAPCSQIKKLEPSETGQCHGGEHLGWTRSPKVEHLSQVRQNNYSGVRTCLSGRWHLIWSGLQIMLTAKCVCSGRRFPHARAICDVYDEPPVATSGRGQRSYCNADGPRQLTSTVWCERMRVKEVSAECISRAVPAARTRAVLSICFAEAYEHLCARSCIVAADHCASQ